MNRHVSFLALIGVVIILAGCAPLVVVENRTTVAVRVIVTSSTGSETVSPSPGESSSAEVAEGSYRVTVIPDVEWIEYAKLTRKVLNDQIANADKLTGPQLLDVIRRLKDIAIRMQDFEKAAGSTASCVGNITQDSGDGVAVITTAPAGALVVSCR